MEDVEVPHNYSIRIRNWMLQDYVPPITNPFDPFRAETVVSAVDVPLLKVAFFPLPLPTPFLPQTPTHPLKAGSCSHITCLSVCLLELLTN